MATVQYDLGCYAIAAEFKRKDVRIMTRKDFELIASVIRKSVDGSVPPVPQGTEVYALAERMAYFLKTTNPLFDRARFMRACGFINEEV